jgi:PiT family inorganic phosphate transporter
MDIATIAIPLALILAIIDGLNNASNAISWAIGGGLISIRKALLIASIFEVIGSVVFGFYIIDMVSYRLITDFNLLKYSFLPISIYASSIIWSVLASIVKVPISFSMAIIGSILGSLSVYGKNSIDWNTALYIFIGWITAFIISIALTTLFLVFNDRFSKHRNIYIYLGIISIASILTLLISKPLKPYSSNTSTAILIFLVFSAILSYIFRLNSYRYTLASLTLISMMHGANDAALIASILMLCINSLEGYTYLSIAIPAIGIAIGVLVWGHRIADTLASSITFIDIRYISAIYISEFIAIALLLRIGLPTPISLVTIGALIGFGIYRGLKIIRFSYAVKSMFITLASTPICIAISYIMTLIINILTR